MRRKESSKQIFQQLVEWRLPEHQNIFQVAFLFKPTCVYFNTSAKALAT